MAGMPHSEKNAPNFAALIAATLFRLRGASRMLFVVEGITKDVRIVVLPGEDGRFFINFC